MFELPETTLDIEPFGQFLKGARKATRMSQRDLAKIVGVDFTYLSKIENGRTPPPSPETIKKIATALGLPVVWFLIKAGLCIHCSGTGKL